MHLLSKHREECPIQIIGSKRRDILQSHERGFEIFDASLASFLTNKGNNFSKEVGEQGTLEKNISKINVKICQIH